MSRLGMQLCFYHWIWFDKFWWCRISWDCWCFKVLL